MLMLFYSVFKFYLENIPPHKKFLVIGYSFGTLVAIEVVRILEDSGLHGHLVCIYGSPEFVIRLVMKILNFDHINNNLIQKSILVNMATTCLPNVNLDAFKERLDLLDEWQTRAEGLNDLLIQSKYIVNETYLMDAATGLYHRSLSVFYHKINEKIQSYITFV